MVQDRYGLGPKLLRDILSAIGPDEKGPSGIVVHVSSNGAYSRIVAHRAADQAMAFSYHGLNPAEFFPIPITTEHFGELLEELEMQFHNRQLSSSSFDQVYEGTLVSRLHVFSTQSSTVDDVIRMMQQAYFYRELGTD